MVPGGVDRRVRFIAGVALMAASFLVFPFYLAIPFLPLSGTMKLEMTALASLLSWAVFGTGFYLSGQEGYEWLKRRLRR